MDRKPDIVVCAGLHRRTTRAIRICDLDFRRGTARPVPERHASGQPGGCGGRTGTSLLAWDGEGHPERESAELGAALKLCIANSMLKYGQQQPSVPVFAVSQADGGYTAI
ncbi:OprD family outer membrane porin [Azotobacter salinestris]|uniref:OprD family outer membrane porin n=1 Tax=Azotobacter salinestris TaxID=69964 RepID=UPI003D7FE864